MAIARRFSWIGDDGQGHRGRVFQIPAPRKREVSLSGLLTVEQMDDLAEQWLAWRKALNEQKDQRRDNSNTSS